MTTCTAITVAAMAERLVKAHEMFGERASEVVAEVATAPADAFAEGIVAATGDPFYQLLVIALFFCVARMVGNRQGLRLLMAGILRGRFTDDPSSGRRDATMADDFAHSATAAAVAAIIVGVSKYSPLWMPDMELPAPWMRMPVAAALAAAATGFTILYQRTAISLIGAVSRNRDFTEQLMVVKRTLFAVTALIVAPTMLLAALSTEGARTWRIILAVECCILSFLFLKELFALFVRKKIPIFQWFLYLCTVEAFPLTLAVALTSRF